MKSLYDSINKIKDSGQDPYCERNRKLIDIVQFVAEQGRPFFVGGGLGLAFAANKLYRCHGDVDLFFLPQDQNFWLQKLGERGIKFLEDEDRGGFRCFRMVGEDEKWLGEIKFVVKGEIADDGLPHRVITNYIEQWVIPTHDPDFNRWQKEWMLDKGEARGGKELRDLQRYFS